MRRIVIIGGLAAGPAAAARAAKHDPSARVTLLEAGDRIAYGVCDFPSLLGRDRELTDLTEWEPERFARAKGVEVLVNRRARAIDARARRVELDDDRELAFDALVIATGSKPVTLGISLERPLKTPADLAVLRAAVERSSGGHAVVLGAGYLGLEVADVLRERGLAVTVCDRESLPLRGVEEPARRLMLAAMSAAGVEFRGGLELVPGWIDGADLVVSALGTQPEVAVARAAGLELGSSGGIRVDARCETSTRGIFAAGDCVETRHRVDGRPIRSTLATSANEAGRVAGVNAAGGSAQFDGISGALVFRAFGLEVGRVGFTEEEARRRGMEARATTVTANSHGAGEHHTVHVSLTTSPSTGRVLGASLIGEGAALRTHAVTIAICAGMTARELAAVDLGYAPPVSSLVDPLRLAARVAESAR